MSIAEREIKLDRDIATIQLKQETDSRMHEIYTYKKPVYEAVPARETVMPGVVVDLLPHDDDGPEFFGVTAQMLVMRGIPVWFALFTDGRKGKGEYFYENNLTEDALVAHRWGEHLSAIAHLSQGNPLMRVDKDVPQSRDLELARNYPKVVQTIHDLVDKYNLNGKDMPGMLVGPNPDLDYHPDHLALGRAMLEVAKSRNVTALMHDTQFGKTYKLGSNAYRVGKDFEIPDPDEYFSSVVPGPNHEASILVKSPIDRHQIKMRAIYEYWSQMYGEEFPPKIAESNRLRGSLIGAERAESFDIGYQSTNGVIYPLSSSLPDNTVFRKVKRGDGLIIPRFMRAAA